MDKRTEELDRWDQRLLLAEQDLQERQQQALSDDPDPSELLVLAAERDRIARDRDDLAGSYDEHARGRDLVSLDRDVAGSGRDQRARTRQDDRDPAAPDRWSAGVDRDLGAGDRGDSYDDRARSRADRERAADDRSHAAQDRDEAAQKASEQERDLDGLRTALEDRHVIGLAQGVLMATHSITTDAAFAVLVRLSRDQGTTLREVAARLVAAAQPEQRPTGRT